MLIVACAALLVAGAGLLGLVTGNAGQPVANGPAVLIAAGDIADCNEDGDSATATLVEGMPGTVIALGDNAYEVGSSSDYAQCYGPTWGAFKSRTRPVPGNHEYGSPGALPYFRYFGADAGDAGRGYYAFELGSWRMYALNSNCDNIGGCGRTSAQYAWLTADLAAHPASCVAAYWHHPRWSSGMHGNQSRMQAIWEALFRAGAEIVLSGHDHDYERFAPQDASGQVDSAFGVREFVVGTGGKSHYGFRDPPLANSQARNDDTFGVLRLQLDTDAYTWQFMPVAGGTFTDRGTTPCHSAPPSTQAS